MENKFKVGDIIKGKKESHEEYAITTEDMTMAKVISTECFDEDDMRIKILSHKTDSDEVGEVYANCDILIKSSILESFSLERTYNLLIL